MQEEGTLRQVTIHHLFPPSCRCVPLKPFFSSFLVVLNFPPSFLVRRLADRILRRGVSLSHPLAGQEEDFKLGGGVSFSPKKEERKRGTKSELSLTNMMTAFDQNSEETFSFLPLRISHTQNLFFLSETRRNSDPFPLSSSSFLILPADSLPHKSFWQNKLRSEEKIPPLFSGETGSSELEECALPPLPPLFLD